MGNGKTELNSTYQLDFLVLTECVEICPEVLIVPKFFSNMKFYNFKTCKTNTALF